MGYTRTALLALLALPLLMTARLEAQDNPFEKYVWETYRVSDVSPAAKDMVAELQGEVQKILDAGPLAPLRAVYADITIDMYFMYWQPGRIITTLAYAYPYLTPAQQAAAKKYVQAELADENRAPWCAGGCIPAGQGAKREIDNFQYKDDGWSRYWGMWGRTKSIMGSFYGLWLYADRTGDWETIKAHYDAIKRMYIDKAKNCDIYGNMGAHIAMARIARHLGDEDTANLAANGAKATMAMGKSFATVEKNTQKYFKERYDSRQQERGYQGWMFLELSPELGRYLADNVKEDVLKRNDAGLRAFPLFWLRQALYWARWTGDEGEGVPTELMGMIVPVQRWVAQVPPQTLAVYSRSAPICIGDCYWLEMLVSAIESTGKTTWEAVERR